MKNTIYYFTGTGNSLYIAKNLSESLNDCDLIPMTKFLKYDQIPMTSEKIGFVFPLFFWGLPRIVHDFVEKVELDNVNYIFAVVTRDGDDNGIPLIQIERILKSKEKTLNSGFFIQMPNSYILDDQVTPQEEQKKRFEEALRYIKEIAQIIENNEKTVEIDISKTRKTIEKMNRTFREKVYESDKFFYTDESCNKCGICEQVCPVNNILLIEGKPQWQHKCEQCLACINYCPEQSIQYAEKTLQKGRYHHPEIKVKDLINFRG